MMRNRERADPPRKAFLFCFSLQAGVATYTAVVFIVMISSALHNLTAEKRYTAWSYGYGIMYFYITLNIFSLIFISTGAFLFNERIVYFGSFLLTILACVWAVLSVLSLVYIMPAYEVLCIDERCPTTHWLFDENFRSQAPDCETKSSRPDISTTDGATTEEATTDGATTEEATTEEATTEGATTDEATTEGATTDEATTDGATTEEATTDGTTTEEATTDGATTEEATTDGTTTEEATTDGTTTEGATTDGATTEEATTDGATTEEATTDGATTEEATTEEATTDGATTDGATSDGATSDGATTDGATTDGETSDGATTDGATSDGATSDGATTDGATSEEATTDGATTDEATTDEATTEEATTDEATTDEATTDGATTEEATTDGATTDGATTEEATTEEATTEGATTEGATTDGATSDGATSDGATSDGATTDGATSDGATSDGATSDRATSDGATTDGATTDKARTDEKNTIKTDSERIIQLKAKSKTAGESARLRKTIPDTEVTTKIFSILTKTENPVASYNYTVPQSASIERRLDNVLAEEATSASTLPAFNGPAGIAGRRFYSDTAGPRGILAVERLTAKSHQVRSGLANLRSYKREKFVRSTPDDQTGAQIPINIPPQHMHLTVIKTPLGAAMSYPYTALPSNSSSALFTSYSADVAKKNKTSANKESTSDGEDRVEGYDSFVTGVTRNPDSTVAIASFSNTLAELKTIPSNPPPGKNSGGFNTVLSNTGITENSPDKYRYGMPNANTSVTASSTAREIQPVIENQSKLVWMRSSSAVTPEDEEPSLLNTSKTAAPSQVFHVDEPTNKHFTRNVSKSWGAIYTMAGKVGGETVSDQRETEKRSPIGVVPFGARYKILEKYCRFTYLNFLWTLTLFLTYAGFTVYGLLSCFTFGKELRALRNASEYTLE